MMRNLPRLDAKNVAESNQQIEIEKTHE